MQIPAASTHPVIVDPAGMLRLDRLYDPPAQCGFFGDDMGVKLRAGK
ncbi:MAG: hypothetical protein ACLQU4_22050 [Limisphaerales bacterium]